MSNLLSDTSNISFFISEAIFNLIDVNYLCSKMYVIVMSVYYTNYPRKYNQAIKHFTCAFCFSFCCCLSCFDACFPRILIPLINSSAYSSICSSVCSRISWSSRCKTYRWIPVLPGPERECTVQEMNSTQFIVLRKCMFQCFHFRGNRATTNCLIII